MVKFYNRKFRLKVIILLVFTVIAVASLWFTHDLVNSLAQEEKKKIEIWADATRQLILADENTNVDFLLNIIEDNTTIPVIMTDDHDRMLQHRNIKTPSKNEAQFFERKIGDLKENRPSIVIKLDENNKQYIYYDESLLL